MRIQFRTVTLSTGHSDVRITAAWLNTFAASGGSGAEGGPLAERIAALEQASAGGSLAEQLSALEQAVASLRRSVASSHTRDSAMVRALRLLQKLVRGQTAVRS